MKFQLVLAIFTLLTVSSTVNSIQPERHQFPFVVGLISGQTRCTGTLISRRAILTVSACLTSSTTEIILGASDMANRNEPSQVRFTINEASYHRDSNSLLAIIRFEPQIAFLTETINIIQLPFSTPTELFTDVSGTSLGFLNATTTPDVIHSFNVRTIRNQDCTRAHPSITNEQICTSNSNGCTLSLGAPIVTNFGGRQQQIAIQFRRNSCSSGSNTRSIFLRITPYLMFIRSNM